MGIEISRLHLRRSAFIQATPERVWEEFESLDRLRAWFGVGHTLEVFEPRLGGAVTISIESGGGRSRYGGPIRVWQPAGELTFENNWHGSGAWPVPTFITLRLTPLYDGTLVELFHHGFERLGADAAAELEGYEAGWDSHHLQGLRKLVEG